MTTASDTVLKQTPLYDLHKNLKAKMAAFAGWDMPMVYAGVIDEHHAVRKRVGMFDVAHMGVVEVSGPQALEGLEKLTVNQVSKLVPGKIQYSMILNEKGGIRDDILIYHIEKEKYWVIVNGSNVPKILEWFNQKLPRQAFVTYLIDDYVPFAVQGPYALTLLRRVFPKLPADFKRFTFVWMDFLGKPTVVSRTGYTGEDGVEFLIHPSVLPAMWNLLLEEKVTPCGLACRDTLRLEAGLPLYGHELSETTFPIQTQHAWVIKWDKADFVGKAAMLAEKAQPSSDLVLVGLEMEGRAIPREGYPIQEGGSITSGTFAPTLAKPIAMAYLHRSLSAVGTQVHVVVRDQTHAARVRNLPFYVSKTI